VGRGGGGSVVWGFSPARTVMIFLWWGGGVVCPFEGWQSLVSLFYLKSERGLGVSTFFLFPPPVFPQCSTPQEQVRGFPSRRIKTVVFPPPCPLFPRVR